MAGISAAAHRRNILQPTIAAPPRLVFDKKILGHDSVPADALARRLRRPAWYLWLRLCALRDCEGVVREAAHVIVRGLTSFQRASMTARDRAVDRAMAKLRLAGLVEGCGLSPLDAGPSGGWGSPHFVYGYRVMGMPACAPSEVTCKVPKATKGYLQTSSSGGARKGAGRPRNPNSKAVLRNSKAVLAQFKSGASSEIEIRNSESPSGEGDPPRGGGGDSSFGERASGQPASGAASASPPPARRRPSGGSGGPPWYPGGPPTLERPPKAPGDPGTFPPFLSVVHNLMARQPMPPLLRPEAGDAANAQHLATLTTGAMKAVLGKGYHPFDRKSVAASPWRKILIAASHALVAHNLAPAVWCRWSLGYFRDHEQAAVMRARGKTPPIPWLWSPARIAQHHGWCRSEVQIGGNCIAHTPTTKELMKRQLELRTELDLAQARAGGGMWRLRDDEIDAIVERELPWPLYRELFAKAKEDYTRMTADFDARAARGEWVW